MEPMQPSQENQQTWFQEFREDFSDRFDTLTNNASAFVQVHGRCVFAYPALLGLQTLSNAVQSNPALLSSVSDLLLKVGNIGQHIIGMGQGLATGLVQAGPLSVIGMHALANIAEHILIEDFEFGSLTSKIISVIGCAGVFTLVGLVPTFTTGVAVLLTAKLVGVVWNKAWNNILVNVWGHFTGNPYINTMNLGLHFGVGTLGTIGIQTAVSSVRWGFQKLLAPQMIGAINALNPLHVGGMFALFSVIDLVAKEVFIFVANKYAKTIPVPDLDDITIENPRMRSITAIDHPSCTLIRIPISILATAAVATSFGIASSIAAAGVVLTVSIVTYTALSSLTFHYNNNRDGVMYGQIHMPMYVRS